jgi:hypothetical protein
MTCRHVTAREIILRRVIVVLAMTIIALILVITNKQLHLWQPDDAPKMTCAVTDARDPFPPLFLRGLL